MAFNDHHYGVFSFLDENAVEFVDFAPTVWADKESWTLQWPPGKMSKNARKHDSSSIEKSWPKSNWITCNIVKVIYTTSTSHTVLSIICKMFYY